MFKSIIYYINISPHNVTGRSFYVTSKKKTKEIKRKSVTRSRKREQMEQMEQMEKKE